ncbi:cupin domain-containing protein [Actinomadura sp. K4S16]|uniref:cupin domain-containing protein n=1 Tax=Actinomadura sp. K4S16 TaxID=1316147 RepID=UPI0011EC9ED5|nr:cupin domain-containing protein [Actinomadura sp. K4S16]
MSALRIVSLPAATAAVLDGGVAVHGAPAKGLGLHLSGDGHLGADIIHVPAGGQFPVHTHPGHHLLLCLEGLGTITVDEVVHQVRPGDLYMVDGQVPHAVGAGDRDHVLVAIGAPHRPVDSPDRMTFTDWEGTRLDEPLFPPPAPARSTGRGSGKGRHRATGPATGPATGAAS